MADLTPDKLFNKFRASTKSWEKTKIGAQAIEEFKSSADKKAFLEPTIHFLESEQNDRARAWGTNILELIGGSNAFECLAGLLNEKDPKAKKRQYLYTRFFSLRALNAITQTPEDTEKVETICRRIWKDVAEDYLVKSEAAAILASKAEAEPLKYLKDMLSEERYPEFWPACRTLRALREFPIASLADAILDLIKNEQPGLSDLRWNAIRTAGSYRKNADIVYELGKIVREEEHSFLRVEAVKSFGELCDPLAKDYLMYALQDDDAEIRYQAANAMKAILPMEKTAAAIIQLALEPGTSPHQRTYLTDGLRVIDPTRAVPTEILNRELSAEDRQRAETAERLLIDLGGWAAVQSLGQRRLTLNQLDSLLSDSEKIVRDTFEGTIRQARFNFYFAMAVNIIVVVTGIAFIGLAIWQLIENPQNLASWILPGTTGVLGVLINLVFNNPRNNARDDLTSLLNATAIFLGFLRRLNEIDATFKYAYLEDPNFNAARMQETIAEIERAVAETVGLTIQSLRTPKTDKKSEQPQGTDASKAGRSVLKDADSLKAKTI